MDLHGLQLAFSRKAAQGQCYAVLEALCEASKTTQLNGLWLSQENHKEADKAWFDSCHLIDKIQLALQLRDC